MIQHIMETLAQYEIDNNVKIIFAVVFGSREFGHERATSDYDIALVYISSHGRLMNGGGYLEYFEGTKIAYTGIFLDDYISALLSNDSYQVNMLNAKEILIDTTGNFQSSMQETYPYDKERFIYKMYIFTIMMFNGNVFEQEETPVNSAYLKCISTLQRIRWLELNDNLNFPLTRKLLYLNYNETVEAKQLLETTDRLTSRKPYLDVYILRELQRIKGEYNIEG